MICLDSYSSLFMVLEFIFLLDGRFVNARGGCWRIEVFFLRFRYFVFVVSLFECKEG